MRSKIALLISITALMIFSGCAKKPEHYDYSAFLKSKPKSILVVMPQNESLDIKGSPAVLANAILPLSEAGYYVFPPAVVQETFKQNGVYSANDIANIPLPKLKEIFGADSVLYLDVKKYGNSYIIVSSKTEVAVSAKLVDIDTQKVIWAKSARYAESSGNSSSGIIGILLSAVVTQIINETTDNSYKAAYYADMILFANQCNGCILYGPKSPNYQKDKQLQSAK